MEEEEEKEPQETSNRRLWWTAIIIVGVPVLIIALLSWQLHWSWLPNLWFNYAWSSDKGNGPEALQQTIVYGLIAVILVPPIRHALERFAKRHVESIKTHVSEENKVIHEKLHVMHETQKHIIRHSDVPNKIPGLDPEHWVKEEP